jgi:hypothetical protein
VEIALSNRRLVVARRRACPTPRAVFTVRPGVPARIVLSGSQYSQTVPSSLFEQVERKV